MLFVEFQEESEAVSTSAVSIANTLRNQPEKKKSNFKLNWLISTVHEETSLTVCAKNLLLHNESIYERKKALSWEKFDSKFRNLDVFLLEKICVWMKSTTDYGHPMKA